MDSTNQPRLSKFSAAMRMAILCGAGFLVMAVMLLPQIRGKLKGQAAAAARTSEGTAASAKVDETAVVDDLRALETDAPSEDTPDAQRFHEQIRWVKTIRVLPKEDTQLESAHRLARRDACEPIPANEPVISQNFQPYLTRRDYREYAENVPALSMRQPIFSVGLDMLASDQRDLPSLSARRILAYLRGNYISLQVRVQKEPLSGDLFLHHRSLAAVAQYQVASLTQPPTEGLGKTLQNYRSLGLFLPAEAKPTPPNLRTLVLIHKSDRAADASAKLSATKYEYVFVRARPKGSGQNQSLVLHTFATAERRQKLYYLKSSNEPSRNDLCSFKTMIYFTDYSHAGLYPVESASRGTVFNDRGEYLMSQLEAYATTQQWEGGALQNLTKLLDAIIDGRIAEQ